MHPRFDPPAQPPSTPPPSGRESPDATLTRLRERLAAPTPEAYAEAARYLAFRGTGWENRHRYEVVELLQAHAADAAPAILAKASAFPRADVCDAAADALDPLVTTAEGVAVLASLYHADPSLGVQRVCACAFGRATGAAAVAAARRVLRAEMASPDEERRETAGVALATLEIRYGRDHHAMSVTHVPADPVVTFGTAGSSARPGDVGVTVTMPLRSIVGTVRLAGDDTPGNTLARTAADTSAPAAHSTAHPATPRRTLDAATIAEAIAAHPTRSAAATALGVDTSYLRRLARRLGVAWPEADRAPGSAGGAWAGDNRREAAREWMRRRRAARATRKGTAEDVDGGAAHTEPDHA